MQFPASDRQFNCSERMMSSTILLVYLSFSLVFVASLSIPSSVTPPYQPNTLVESAAMAQSTVQISSPTQLAGRFTFTTAPYGGGVFFVNSSQQATGNYLLEFEFVMPNSLDGVSGCENLNYSYSDDGSPIAGKILLLERRGGCNFQQKADTAFAIGAAAVVVYNCGACEVGLVRPANFDSSIPFLFIQMEDGQLLMSYLRERAKWLQDGSPVNGSATYSSPVLGSVVGTGTILPSELAALQLIASQMTIDSASLADSTTLRNWNELIPINNVPPNFDPCLDRIAGVWCERGSIVSVYLKYINIEGTFSSAWGNLTQLRYLTFAENVPGLSGSVPSSICNLNSLISVQLETNLLSSIPDCLGQNGILQVLTIDRNHLTSLPSGIGSSGNSFVYLTASFNQLTSLPATYLNLSQVAVIDLSNNPNLILMDEMLLCPGMYQLYQLKLDRTGASGQLPPTAFSGATNLISLDLSYCNLSGPLPTSFESLLLLHDVNLQHNYFEGSLTSNQFNGLQHLVSLDLSNNYFVDVLPDFIGCSSLTRLILGHNQFSGGIPSKWGDLSSLVYLDVSHNSLTSPLDALVNLPVLQQLLLNHNQLYLTDDMNQDIGQWLFSITTATLLELYVQNNQLIGDWGVGWTSSSLLKLNISSNGVRNLPTDLWTSVITYLDASNNTLSGTVPVDINDIPGQAPVTTLYLQGNPDLRVFPLPSWLTYAPGVYIGSDRDNFECLELTSPTFPGLAVKLDSISTDYHGCRCKNGTFGLPPICIFVPVAVILKPFNNNYTNNGDIIPVGTPYFNTTFIQLLEMEGDQDTIGVINNSSYSHALTDSWYGSRRLTAGLSTSWTINLAQLRQSLTDSSETTDNPPVDPTAISSDELDQPVRYITVRVHLSQNVFNASSANIITIITGDTTNAGTLVFSQIGMTLPANCSINSSYTLQATYQLQYSTLLNALGPSCLFEIDVPSSIATIFFTSRATEGHHFVATYSHSFVCPTGQSLNDMNECAFPESVSTNYVPIILGVSGALLLVTFIWLVRERCQRAKQSVDKKDGSIVENAVPESDVDIQFELDQAKLKYAKLHLNNLRRELVMWLCTIICEIVLICLTWTSVVRQLQEGITRVAIIYAGICILALIAWGVNMITRYLGTRMIWEEIKVAQMQSENPGQQPTPSTLHTIQHGSSKVLTQEMIDLNLIDRKILLLRITAIALLFDDLPLLILNTERSINRCDEPRFILQCVFGAILIGSKLTRLRGLGRLQEDRSKHQLKFFQSRHKQLISRTKHHASTSKLDSQRRQPTGLINNPLRSPRSELNVVYPIDSNIPPSSSVEPHSSIESNPIPLSSTPAHHPNISQVSTSQDIELVEIGPDRPNSNDIDLLQVPSDSSVNLSQLV